MAVKKDSFADNTYSLAKGLHHINLAKMYFDDVRLGATGEVKSLFNLYIAKCDWIINNMKNRLPEENRRILSKELEESISIEAIMDKLIHINNDQKAFIENLVESMIKGEEIKIIDNK